MRTLLMRYAIPFAVGIAGLLTGVVALHLWNDHQALHAVIAYINQQEAAKGAH